MPPWPREQPRATVGQWGRGEAGAPRSLGGACPGRARPGVCRQGGGSWRGPRSGVCSAGPRVGGAWGRSRHVVPERAPLCGRPTPRRCVGMFCSERHPHVAPSARPQLRGCYAVRVQAARGWGCGSHVAVVGGERRAPLRWLPCVHCQRFDRDGIPVPLSWCFCCFGPTGPLGSIDAGFPENSREAWLASLRLSLSSPSSPPGLQEPTRQTASHLPLWSLSVPPPPYLPLCSQTE